MPGILEDAGVSCHGFLICEAVQCCARTTVPTSTTAGANKAGSRVRLEGEGYDGCGMVWSIKWCSSCNFGNSASGFNVETVDCSTIIKPSTTLLRMNLENANRK